MSTGKGYTGWKLVGAAVFFVALISFFGWLVISGIIRAFHRGHTWTDFASALAYGLIAGGINYWWNKRKSRRATAS